MDSREWSGDIRPKFVICIHDIFLIAETVRSELCRNPLASDGFVFRVQLLTFYRAITTFNDIEKGAFWKHCGKRRKCW